MSALGSTVLLTAVSLFGQGVGFFYRVLLSRLVGSEVMGLYQLVMPAFSVLLSLTAVGPAAACAHLTARCRAEGDLDAARQVLRRCLLVFLAAFGLTASLAAPLSDAISVYLLGDARARLGLLLLLPCALLTGVENVHKQAFYGAGRVRPPALSEICEQLIRTGAVLGLLWRFLPQNPERAVGLIVCGMVVCEVFSAIALSLLYRRLLSGRGRPRRGPPALTGHILRLALPVGATALLGNLMGAWTSVLIPARLVRAGADVSAAMSAFGVLCGMTLPLLSLPAAPISAMGLVLLPKLARHAALNDRAAARRLAGRALTAAAWLAFPGCALLWALAPPLARLLFRDPAAGAFAAPLAAAVALTCLESVLAFCLNGLGYHSATARNALICGAAQLFLTWAWMALPGVGLAGYVGAVVVSTLLGLGLNWASLARAIALKPQLFPWLVGPGLAALLAGTCTRLLYPVLARSGLGAGWACLGCVLFGAVLYLCAMAAQGLLERPGRRK